MSGAFPCRLATRHGVIDGVVGIRLFATSAAAISIYNQLLRFLSYRVDAPLAHGVDACMDVLLFVHLLSVPACPLLHS